KHGAVRARGHAPFPLRAAALRDGRTASHDTVPTAIVLPVPRLRRHTGTFPSTVLPTAARGSGATLGSAGETEDAKARTARRPPREGLEPLRCKRRHGTLPEDLGARVPIHDAHLPCSREGGEELLCRCQADAVAPEASHHEELGHIEDRRVAR